MNLIITLNFTGVPNLEKLVLERCKNLQELDPSIGVLKKLILLNIRHCEKLIYIRHCEKLIYLPNNFKMESLVILELSGCLNVKKFPEFVGSMEYLQHLSLKCTAITEMTSLVQRLVGLTSLTLIACKNLVRLPSTIFSLTLLIELDLSGCPKFDNLPKELGNAKSLKELNLNGTAIRELPSSIERLIGLILLSLRDCKNLVYLPNSICSLKSRKKLDLSGCSKVENLPKNLGNVEGLKVLNLSEICIKELPSSIERLTSLTSLTLRDCKNLVCLPNTICSLKLHECLDLFGCSKVENLPKNLGNVKGLKVLNLIGTTIKEVPSSIALLKNLKKLNIHRFNETSTSFYSLPNSIGGFSSLRRLDLSVNDLECIYLSGGLDLSGNNFDSIPDSIGGLSSLVCLDLSGNNFDSIPDSIGGLSSLECLDLSGNNFDSIPHSIGGLSSLRCLDLSGNSFDSLPDSIGGLSSLVCLELSGNNFDSIPDSIGGLSSLVCLDLSGNNFDSIPDSIGGLSSLECLNLSGNNFELSGCKWLQSFSELPFSLHFEHARFCNLCFSMGSNWLTIFRVAFFVLLLEVKFRNGLTIKE